MEFSITEKTDRSIRFGVMGASNGIANALRRIMLAEVPSMAIEDVVVVENSSPTYDEMLAHRLGLVPLKTDLKNYILPEECTCMSELGCEKCRVVLTMDVEAGESTMTAYSSNLSSDDPEIVPVSANIPLTKLAPGQRIRVEAYARLGTGDRHAKWSPVSASTYKQLPLIVVDSSLCTSCGKCVISCVKHVLAGEGIVPSIARSEDCTLCGDCVEECPVSGKGGKKAIMIEESSSLLFYVESTGCLLPENIFSRAAEILGLKAGRFIDELSIMEA